MHVILDPGHDGAYPFDPGAVGSDVGGQEVTEAAISDRIATDVKRLVSAERTWRGATTVGIVPRNRWTVKPPAGAPAWKRYFMGSTGWARARVSWAREREPLVFLSIHCNSGGGGRASGTEVIVSDRAGTYSQLVAEVLSRRVSASLGIPNRGVKADRTHLGRTLGVLRGHGNYPAVLLETFFIDNPTDVQAYVRRHEQVAEAISGWLVDLINGYIPG